MKKNLYALSFFILTSFATIAQINGSSTVCAGISYTYSVSILNASSYTWTLPSGWYDITGQSTSQINATCNVNDGLISVEGFNSNGISVGLETLSVFFSSGSGWQVSSSAVYACAGQISTSPPISIAPNGTGGGPGCPNGCGSGVPNADIDFVMYDNPWPAGNFVAVCPAQYMMPFQQTTFYVYKVDYTAGFTPNTQAILIEGGCGNATFSNTIAMFPSFPLQISLSQNPLPACVGDTLWVVATNLNNFHWNMQPSASYGITNVDTINNPGIFILDSLNAFVDIIGLDNAGCFNAGSLQIVTDSCALTGIEHDAGVQSISVYPNPASNYILIKLKQSKPVLLQIINTLGQIVYENKNARQETSVCIESLSRGVYTLKAGNVVERFFVE